MKDDDEEKCGYGPINLNGVMGPYLDSCKWHDRQTDQRTSTAAKANVSNERMVEAWADQIDERGKQPDMARQGFYKQVGRFSKTVIRWVNRWFYEGPR
jgi:hypothetical protein